MNELENELENTERNIILCVKILWLRRKSHMLISIIEFKIEI